MSSPIDDRVEALEQHILALETKHGLTERVILALGELQTKAAKRLLVVERRCDALRDQIDRNAGRL